MVNTYTGSEAHWDYLDHALAWVRATLALIGTRRLEEVPPDAANRLAEQIGNRRVEMEQHEATWGDALPLVALRHRWKLSQNDTTILLFSFAQRMDPTMAPLLAAASGHAEELTGRVLEQVAGESLRARLRMRQNIAPTSALVSSGLVVVQPSFDDPTDFVVRITEKGLSALTEHAKDEEIATERLSTPFCGPKWMLRRMERIALSNLDRPPTYIVLITGNAGLGKTTAAHFLVSASGKVALAPNLHNLHENPQDIPRIFHRALTLTDGIIILDDCEGLLHRSTPRSRATSAFLNAASQHAGLAVLTTAHPELLDEAVLSRVHARLDLQMPNVAERTELWRIKTQSLLAGTLLDHELLARRFDLSGAQIHNAAWMASRTPNPTMADLTEACRMQLQHRFKQPAEPSAGRLRLHNLILPKSTLNRVESFLAAATCRAKVLDEWGFGEKFSTGLGLSALFDGDPGTGKTLAAEIIAEELGLYVHRVNIAQVLDKYVGETEKNLARIFQEASAASTLLLFDEADALFSSRVNVENSQDRFANLEINLLLQLMERYFGVVILTTNLKHGIDKAFERRIGYKIHFPFPDADLREQIWQNLLPNGAPTAPDLDFYDLAQRFELSGGSIKNALLRAAYAAAARGGMLTTALLEEAAEQECEAAGKLYRPAARSERSIL